MNAMKKSILGVAVLMSMCATAAQAQTQTYSFTGAFTMYRPFVADLIDEGTITEGTPILTGNMIPNPAATSKTGPVIEGSNSVAGFMNFDMMTGAGTASLTPFTTFLGYYWTATGITMQITSAPGDPVVAAANMLFHWNGNLSIPVSMNWAIDQFGYLTTLDGNGDGIPGTPMVSGPFPGFNATFAGQLGSLACLSTAPPCNYNPCNDGLCGAVVAPIPAAAWLLGSGLLGLIGVARRKAA